jgi:hypothetical protein
MNMLKNALLGLFMTLMACVHAVAALAEQTQP